MKNYRTLIIMIFLAMVLVVSGCNSQAASTQKDALETTGMSCITDTCAVSPVRTVSADVQKIEIYHFHGTNQCTSCIAVGKLAEETVNTYFADELKSGKIVFGHINGELPENSELVRKYGATGSSLWIGVYDSNGFHKEENTNVWYKIQDKPGYMTYLKGIIDKRLQDDFS